MLAYELQKHATRPFTTTLFEASARLGGKILTRQFSNAPLQYEAGAAELYDYSRVGEDPLRQLIAELQLPTRPMGGSTVILENRLLANTDDIRDALGPKACHVLQQFDRVAKDWMSSKEYYNSDWKEANGDRMLQDSFQSVLSQIPNDLARRYLQTMVHSDLATEPHLTNGSYGLQNYLMNDPAYMKLYSIDGGIERLPRELASRIEANVRLNQRVTLVEKTEENRVRVHSVREDTSIHEDFDFVVVALPNNLLPNLEWGGDVLTKAMTDHHAYYDYPAHYLRVTLLFKERFWRDRITESWFMLDAFDGCCLYDESSRNESDSYGALGWLLGGEAALRLSSRSDEELIPMMLQSIPPFWNAEAAQLLEGHVHRWVGAVNGLPAGVPAVDMDRRHQPEPGEHPNLFVIGDYLFDSTLNGVLDSAIYVSDWLVAEMERAPLF